MTIKLQYLLGSKQINSWMGINGAMWNVIEPKLEGYDYSAGYPTFGLRGLKEMGLIK